MSPASRLHVFTFAQDYRAFVAALRNGERCEIDEAMFIHWLETARPVCMRRDVVLIDRSELRADFVSHSPDGGSALEAFWQQSDQANPTDRRYFAQQAVCVV